MEVLYTSIAAVALPYIAGRIGGFAQSGAYYGSGGDARDATVFERARSLVHDSLAASIWIDRSGPSPGQASLWSYVDDFRYMALVCFGCVPIVFALKKAVRKGPAGAAH